MQPPCPTPGTPPRPSSVVTHQLTRAAARSVPRVSSCPKTQRSLSPPSRVLHPPSFFQRSRTRITMSPVLCVLRPTPCRPCSRSSHWRLVACLPHGFLRSAVCVSHAFTYRCTIPIAGLLTCALNTKILCAQRTSSRSSPSTRAP